MGTAANIPLSFQSPQVQSPTDALLKAATLRDVVQRAQMQPEQLQAAQQENQLRGLQLQEAQMDLQDQKTIRQSYLDAQGNLDQWQKLVTERGVSPKNQMALNASLTDMRQKAANLTEAQGKINDQHGKLIADEAMGLKALTPDQRAAQYPAMINRLHAAGVYDQNAAQAALANPKYDDDTLTTLIAHGGQLQHQSEIANQAATQQRIATQEAVTELQAKRLPNVRSQQDLDNLREEFRARNIPQATLDNLIPKTWQPGMDKTFAAAAIPAQDRAKQPKEEADSEQAVRANWAGKLAAAATREQYGAVLNEMPYALAKNLPKVEDFDPKTTPAQIQKWGQTVEQQVTSAATAARDANTEAYRNVTTDLRRLALNTRPAEQKQQETEAVLAQVNRAISESARNGGVSIDDAIRNVQQFYQDDPAMTKYRGQVLDLLNRYKGDQNRAVPKAGAGGGFSFQNGKFVQGGGNAPPTSGPPTTQTPSQPAAQPPKQNPPAAKFTEAQVRARAKNAGIDPDQAVARAKLANLIQ